MEAAISKSVFYRTYVIVFHVLMERRDTLKQVKTFILYHTRDKDSQAA